MLVGVRVVALVLAGRQQRAGQGGQCSGSKTASKASARDADRGVVEVERSQGAAEDGVVLEACRGGGELGMATEELTLSELVGHLVLVEGGQSVEVAAPHERSRRPR